MIEVAVIGDNQNRLQDESRISIYYHGSTVSQNCVVESDLKISSVTKSIKKNL